jgi:hypothetical protein
VVHLKCPRETHLKFSGDLIKFLWGFISSLWRTCLCLLVSCFKSLGFIFQLPREHVSSPLGTVSSPRETCFKSQEDLFQVPGGLVKITP